MNLASRPTRPSPKFWVSTVAVLALLAGTALLTAQPPAEPVPIMSSAATPATPADPAPTVSSAATPADSETKTEVKELRPGTFKISVNNAPIHSVLRLLALQGNRNIVATKEISGQVTVDLSDVTFDEALKVVLASAGYVYRKEGRFVWVYTKEQLDKILEDERKMTTKVFPLFYLTAEDAQKLITPLLSESGKTSTSPPTATGIAVSATDTGGNSFAVNAVILVHDFEDIVANIEKILAQWDVRPQQVLIEATILRATLGEDNALGIDFNTLAGIDFETAGSTSTLTTSISHPPVAIGVPSNRYSGLDTAFTGAVPAGGLSFGLITNNIAMFVRALQSVTDTTVLANPKLLVVNKMRGEVMVGSRDGYLTTTFTETTASQTVQFLETGTRLLVRPYICKDGYIRMEIHPEDSSGSVEQVGASALPSETTTEITTNLMVRDGHTIVIGGLFRESNTASRSQVPLAGNIPYLGTMFRNTVDDINREEVIILITPRIIRHENDEAVSEQIKNDIERFRIGSRLGMRWWSRERMTEDAIAKARRSLTAGDRSKALWYTDMTLSLDPRMAEAIRMKEILTQKAYWADRAGAPTARFVIQRMIMQEMGLPVEPVIVPNRPLDPTKLPPEVRKAMGIEKRPAAPVPGGAPLPAPQPPAPVESGPGVIEIKATPEPTQTPEPSAKPLPAPAPVDPAGKATSQRPRWARDDAQRLAVAGPGLRPTPLPSVRPATPPAQPSGKEVKAPTDPADKNDGGKAPS